MQRKDPILENERTYLLNRREKIEAVLLKAAIAFSEWPELKTLKKRLNTLNKIKGLGLLQFGQNSREFEAIARDLNKTEEKLRSTLNTIKTDLIKKGQVFEKLYTLHRINAEQLARIYRERAAFAPIYHPPAESDVGLAPKAPEKPPLTVEEIRQLDRDFYKILNAAGLNVETPAHRELKKTQDLIATKEAERQKFLAMINQNSQSIQSITAYSKKPKIPTPTGAAERERLEDVTLSAISFLTKNSTDSQTLFDQKKELEKEIASYSPTPAAPKKG